jgi:hypothetical protein
MVELKIVVILLVHAITLKLVEPSIVI